MIPQTAQTALPHARQNQRRLDKLEGSLSPKQAVLHWLGEAHADGSLPAYAEALIDQPERAQPFVALPAQVTEAVWTSMRREPTAAVKRAAREAVADTVFLLRFVIGLNVHIEAVVRTESLRQSALHWWSRALDLDPRGKTKLPPEWRAGVATLVGTIKGTEIGRRAAEDRYLDGHDVLFPELAARWRDPCAAAESLADGVATDDVTTTAQQDIEWVVRMARADGLDAAGQHRAADEMADRVLRTMAGESADG